MGEEGEVVHQEEAGGKRPLEEGADGGSAGSPGAAKRSRTAPSPAPHPREPAREGVGGAGAEAAARPGVAATHSSVEIVRDLQNKSKTDFFDELVDAAHAPGYYEEGSNQERTAWGTEVGPKTHISNR